MQDFVIAISDYAKQVDSNFIVIPQNGMELAFNNLNIDEGFSADYLAAIDGIGIEGLFYNGPLAIDDERLAMARQLVASKKVLVSESLSDDNNISDAFSKNEAEGFICFPRASNNYDYIFIPDTIHKENNTNINNLSDAQNYLYLISTDQYKNKQDFLQAIAASNFDLVLIDLFFEGSALNSSDIQQLKIKANGASRLVICYMNIAAAESYRYYWDSSWKLHNPSWLKKKYAGYADEIWVEFWNQDWQDIIYGNDNSYTKKLLDVGFDGVYLDNVEGYYFLYHN